MGDRAATWEQRHGTLDKLFGVAGHADDCAGRLVYRLTPPWPAQSWFQLLHCKQRVVGRLGLARSSVGIDHLAVVFVRHELAWVEKEFPTAGREMKPLMAPSNTAQLHQGAH